MNSYQHLQYYYSDEKINTWVVTKKNKNIDTRGHSRNPSTIRSTPEGIVHWIPEAIVLSQEIKVLWVYWSTEEWTFKLEISWLRIEILNLQFSGRARQYKTTIGIGVHAMPSYIEVKVHIYTETYLCVRLSSALVVETCYKTKAAQICRKQFKGTGIERIRIINQFQLCRVISSITWAER